MTMKPEDVYLDIKTVLYNIMTKKDELAALPLKDGCIYSKSAFVLFTLKKKKKKKKSSLSRNLLMSRTRTSPDGTQRKLAKRKRTNIYTRSTPWKCIDDERSCGI